MYNGNYDELAKAIVEQAIKDYTFHTKKLLKLMDDDADMEIIEAQARIPFAVVRMFDQYGR